MYDFGPVFRAERSKTRRHLNELWMMDAETAFCDNTMNMDIQESLVKFIIAEVIRVRCAELEILERDPALLQSWIGSSFPRITHADIVKQLQEM